MHSYSNAYSNRPGLACLLVLVDCAIPPAPAVAASTRVSARLKPLNLHWFHPGTWSLRPPVGTCCYCPPAYRRGRRRERGAGMLPRRAPARHSGCAVLGDLFLQTEFTLKQFPARVNDIKWYISLTFRSDAASYTSVAYQHGCADCVA